MKPVAQASANTDPILGSLEFLVFEVGGSHYGIELGMVEELRSHLPIVPMSKAPAYVMGAVDLLGARLALIDMGVALGCGRAAAAGELLVLSMSGQSVAAAVDLVIEVLSVTADMVDPPPGYAAVGAASHLIGVTQSGGRRIVLVDIEELLFGRALAVLEERLA